MVQSLGRDRDDSTKSLLERIPLIRYRDKMIPKYLTRRELGQEVADTDGFGQVDLNYPESTCKFIFYRFSFANFFIIFV